MDPNGRTGNVPISGIRVADGEVPPERLEIRELAKNKYMFNLYVLGLERFQNVNESDPLSYFQIAGIHGLPYTPWPAGNFDKDKQKGIDYVGYCTHSSILFLTWHRPYLALFEAQLHKHVNEVAKGFKDDKDGPKYLEAAKKFRMPYWDWALPSTTGTPVLPNQVLDDGVDLDSIRPKSDRNRDSHNPLSSYRFGDVGKKIGDLVQITDKTVRHPNEQDVEQLTLKSELDGLRAKRDKTYYQKGLNLTERTMYLLQSYDRYNAMSSNPLVNPRDPNFQTKDVNFKKNSGFENWGSLEDSHNAIHDILGGDGGHMGSIATSAFDPIFWLHHTNIDRLWAIWQAIHEDPKKDNTFVTPTYAAETYAMKAGTVDKSTPLAPFHTPSGEFWTSENVRKTAKFGYVYPETNQGVNTKNKIEELYPLGSLANLARASKRVSAPAINVMNARAVSHVVAEETSLNTAVLAQAETPGALPEDISAQAAEIKLPAERHVQDLVSDDKKYLEWLVNVKAEKHSLDGKYQVHFFLGEPENENPALYRFNPTHVAAFVPLGQNADSACANCRKGQEESLEVTGQIPLTMALVERYLAGHIDSLKPEHVQTFLQKELHWRVTEQNGTRLRREDVSKLLVSVVSNEVTIPDDHSQLPKYSDRVEVYPEITTHDGRPRGKGTGYTGGPITA